MLHSKQVTAHEIADMQLKRYTKRLGETPKGRERVRLLHQIDAWLDYRLAHTKEDPPDAKDLQPS